jgi:hypothetical protein
MLSEREAYDAVCAYTLTHGGAAFIHQHVVDAFAAQSADARSKPIGVTFALVGLYLHVERAFTGRQVQRTHMVMARRKRAWPAFSLPDQRGAITARTVLSAPAGVERDRAIDDWCASVWRAFEQNRQAVTDLVNEYDIS